MTTAPTVAFTERGSALFVTISTDTHQPRVAQREGRPVVFLSGGPPSAMSVISEQYRVG